MEQRGQEPKALYSPLDPESRQTRLFTLQKGAFGDPLKGFLARVSLDDDPDYEALSYVWGDPNVTLPVSVDGIEFGVTTNLESALRYLRLKDSPRCLWIDAICINQSDVLERNHQVKNMKLVYQAASAVLAWLGRFTVASKEGLRVLSDLMQNDYGKKELEENGFYAGRRYLMDIFNRNYWKRVWVVQEIALAKRVFLHCGPFSAEIPSGGCLERMTQNLQGLDGLDPFHSFAIIARERSKFKSQKKRLLSILKLREERLVSRLPSLCELVWQFRYWESHDPRDKVFALLGLVSESDAFENSPDYSLSLRQVNNRLLHSYILQHSDLDVLNYADGLQTPIDISSSLNDLEEFDNGLEERHAVHLVPFSSSRGSQFRKFKASKDSIPILGGGPNSNFNLNFCHLTLRGFFIGRIKYLGGRYQYDPHCYDTRTAPDPVTRSNVDWVRQGFHASLRPHHVRYRLLYQWKLLQEWKNRAVSSSRINFSSPYAFPDLENSRTAFWRTIMADSITYEGMTTQHREHDAPNQILRGRQPAAGSWYGQMVDIITSDEFPSDAESFFNGITGTPGFDDICWAIELAVARRTFFLGEVGLMGLAPIATHQGDVISIILGGATPFVLRPASNGFYQLVGECYVQGIMDGEAMVDLAKGEYKLQDIMLV